MTREEAIEIIELEKKHCKIHLNDADKAEEFYKEMNEFVEAYDMAINALKSKDVLDKIKAEIIEKFGNCNICDWFEDYDYEENDISEYRLVGDISDVIEIINKYKTESEEV